MRVVVELGGAPAKGGIGNHPRFAVLVVPTHRLAGAPSHSPQDYYSGDIVVNLNIILPCGKPDLSKPSRTGPKSEKFL